MYLALVCLALNVGVKARDSGDTSSEEKDVVSENNLPVSDMSQIEIDDLLIKSAMESEFLNVQKCIPSAKNDMVVKPSQEAVNNAFSIMVERSSNDNPLLHETLKIMLVGFMKPTDNTVVEVLKSSIEDLDRELINTMIGIVTFTPEDFDKIIKVFVEDTDWQYNKECKDIFQDLLNYSVQGTTPLPSKATQRIISTNDHTAPLFKAMLKEGQTYLTLSSSAPNVINEKKDANTSLSSSPKAEKRKRINQDENSQGIVKKLQEKIV